MSVLSICVYQSVMINFEPNHVLPERAWPRSNNAVVSQSNVVVPNVFVRVWHWLRDSYVYKCNRNHMRCMHVMFSKYMLPRITYLLRNLDASVHLPCKYNHDGVAVGTLTLTEWREILQHIHYSLTLDVHGGATFSTHKLPCNLSEVSEYMIQAQAQENKYKKGFLYLGIYYTEIWG